MPKIKKFIVLIFLLFGLSLLIVLKTNETRTKAASFALETENGSLSGNATVDSDTNASGGKFVQFGNSNTTITQIPTSEPTTPSVAGNISVNFTIPIRQISPLTFAMDISGYGQGSYITNDAAHRDRLTKLKLGMMRMELKYSNGTIVCGGSGCATNISGDDWIKNVKAVGAKPVIITPLDGTRSVDQDKTDSVNLVKHFNKDTNNPVKRWIIGNELDNEGNPHHMTASEYASRFNTIYDTMKTVDPTIKIGGPATAHYNTAFIDTFLAASANKVDFVDFHTYGQGGTENKSETTLLSETSRYTQYLTDLRNRINSKAGSRASQIEMQVGEWNLDWNADPKQYTQFNTVWAASTLGRILHAGGYGFMYADKNGALGALYETSGNGGNKNDTMPIYHAYGMFTGENLFSHFGTTLVQAYTSLANVEVYASNNPKNIVVINKNPSSSHNATFGLAGVSSGTVAVWKKDTSMSAVAAPTKTATLNIINSSLSYTLTPYSVTTFVIQ